MQRSCKAPLPNLIITPATPLRAARETPMLSGRPWLFALKRSTWAKEGDLMCYLQTYTLLKGPHLTRYGAYQREATLWQMKLLFHGNSPATRTANSMTGLLGSWEWRTATELPTPIRAVLCQPPPAVSSKRVCCLHRERLCPSEEERLEDSSSKHAGCKCSLYHLSTMNIKRTALFP